MGRLKFHGDPARFEAVADLIERTYGKSVKYIADAAGGQGMLARLLNKRGYEAEVIDPRGWPLVGVASRQENYLGSMADYYDLVVGLHPDEALREVVASAKFRPVVVVPCCNFWDRNEKLGRDELLGAIERYCRQENIHCKRVLLSFSGPKNIAFMLKPELARTAAK